MSNSLDQFANWLSGSTIANAADLYTTGMYEHMRGSGARRVGEDAMRSGIRILGTGAVAAGGWQAIKGAGEAVKAGWELDKYVAGTVYNATRDYFKTPRAAATPPLPDNRRAVVYSAADHSGFTRKNYSSSKGPEMAPKRGRTSGKKYAKKRVGPSRYGSRPAAAKKAVEKSNGRERLVGVPDYNIPRSMPSNLKYIDTSTGVLGQFIYGMNWMNLGNTSSTFNLNADTTQFDPLAIPVYGSKPPFYISTPGVGSTRAGQRVVVVAIEIQFRIFNPLYAIKSDITVAELAILGSFEASLRCYRDSQCNGQWADQKDIYQKVDDGVNSTINPIFDGLTTLPNVANESRFTELFRLDTKDDNHFDEIYKCVGGAGLTVEGIHSVRTDHRTVVIDEPFLVEYQNTDSNPGGVNGGTGAIDQRKSMNLNFMWACNISNDNLNTLCSPGYDVVGTIGKLPRIFATARTVFYDA